MQIDDAGARDTTGFNVIKNSFVELNAQTGSYNGDLFVVLFTSGKTVERFIHKVATELNDINKQRLRVLVNWDERVFPENAEFDMRSIINSHMVSIITTAKVGDKASNNKIR